MRIPRKYSSAASLLIGVLVALLALAAPLIGVDRSPGWGPGRIALLVVGLFLALVALLVLLDAPGVAVVFGRFGALSARLRKMPAAAALARRLRDYWPLAPISLAVLTLYVWFVSAGTWTTWISPTHYYIDLARGFLQGHLYFAIKVPPDLLRSPDPYALLPNGMPQGPWDVSYYNGKYYSPWGPAPALIEILLYWTAHTWLRDLQLVLGFLFGIYGVAALLAVIVWDRYFSALPRWTLWLSVLLLGFAGPVTFMLDNQMSARVYEAAVTGGQFFLMCGLLVLLAGWRPRPALWTAVLAGLFFVLAAASRPTLLLPAGLVALLLLIHAWTIRRSSPRWFAAPAGFALILLAGIGLLGWYNWARFGSPLETGYYYSMSTDLIHYHWREVFSANYILPNLYNYLVGPPTLRAGFPFLYAEYGHPPAALLPRPQTAYYAAQRIAGVLFLLPFAVFAAGVIPAIAHLLRPRSPSDQGSPRSPSAVAWASLVLGGTFAASFAVLQVYFWAAMRYVDEFMPALILVSSLGFWQLRQRLAQRARWLRIVDGAAIVLAAASILVSILLGLSVNAGTLMFASRLSSLARLAVLR